MRKKKFGIIRKRILSLLLATMMVSSSAVTVFATDDLSFSDGATTEITEQTPEETDVPEVTPEETDVTEETPEETDVTEETPEETDVPEVTPDETDVTEEIPEETDVTEETPVEEPSEEGILIEHYISDVEGEGLLPYEYFAMKYVGTESDDGNSTYAESSRYFSSYSSSKSEYSSTVGYNSLTTAQKEAYDELYNIACTIDESASYDAEYVEKHDKYYFPELSCSIPLEDGVNFSITSVTNIMTDFEYPGIRMMLEATLDRMRQSIKLDISTDDVILQGIVEDNKGYKILPDRYSTEFYGIAIRKDEASKPLKNSINDALSSLESKGIIRKLEKKYNMNYLTAY